MIGGRECEEVVEEEERARPGRMEKRMRRGSGEML